MTLKINAKLLNPQVLNNKGALQFGLAGALNKVKDRIEFKFKNNPGTWRPLRPATIYDRRRQGYGPNPLLFRSGHLAGEAVQESHIQPGSGYVATSDPIAFIQDQGQPDIKLPARPFYDLTEEDLKLVDDAFSDAFIANWNK